MSWLSKIIRKGEKEIKDTVGDVVETIDDAKDFLVDDVLDPVVEAAEDVYKAIEDDPLYNIAKIAAVATGNSWAIPLIEGAKVANNGGDWRDIAEASAKAYIAGKVGATAGSATNAYVSEAVNSEVAGAIIGQATGRAASTAVMTNGDLNAVRDSFITGGISAGVDEAFAWMDETSGTYADLNQSVKNVITTYVKAEANNQDVTNEMMANAALSGAITSELMRDYIDKDSSLSDAELAAITSGFTRTLSAAMTGGNVEREAMTAISNYGSIQMKEWMDTTGKNLVNKGLDRITGAYSEAEEAAARLDGSRQFLDNYYIKNYNEVVDKFRPEMEARDAAYEEYMDAFEANQIQPSKATYDAAMAAKSRYIAALVDFNNKFQPYEYKFNQARVALNGGYNNLEDNQKAYEEAIANLRQNADQISDDLKPLYEIQNKIVTEALTGGQGVFNEEEYRQLNNLDTDTDAFEHYLNEGRANNAPINAEQHAKQLELEQNRAITGTLKELGISVTKLNEDQQKILTDYYKNMSLDELKAADVSDMATEVRTELQKTINPEIRKDLVEKGVSEDDLFQMSFQENPNEIGRVEGVSDADIVAGRARLKAQDDGLIKWENVKFSVPTPTYNDKLGMFTLKSDFIDDDGTRIIKETSVDGRVINEGSFENLGIEQSEIDGKYYQVWRAVSDVTQDGEFIPLYTASSTDSIGGDGTPARVTVTGRVQISDEVQNDGGLSLADLQREDQVGFASTVGQLAQEAGSAVYDFYTEPFIELARQIYDNSETVQNVINSDTFQDYVVNVGAGATGELLSDLNGLAILFGIDPTSTPLAEIADDLKTIAKGAQSEGYSEAVTRIQNKTATANFQKDEKGNLILDESGNPIMATNKDGSPLSAMDRAWRTAKAIAGAAWEDPTVFAAEYIGKELVQELPLALASFGTANLTKAAFTSAGKEIAEEYGKKVGFTTAMVTDAAESWGGTANQAYNEAYAVAKKAGYSDEEAQVYARDRGIVAGNIALATFTGVNTGLNASTLNRKMFGGNKNSGFEEAVEIVFRETASEGLEEALPQAYLETELVKLDPGRDSVGNVTANALLGMISGAGTSTSITGVISTGDAVANAVSIFNPEVRNVLSSAPNTAEGAAQVQQQLLGLGITNPSTQATLLDTVYDEGYVSPTEAYNAAVNYSQNSEIPYSFNAQDINTFVGANPEADLGTSVANYAGQRVTSDFVNDQISQYGYGYTPSQADIDALINSGFITNEQTKKDKTQEIIDYLDPFVNSEQDVRKAYTEIGVNPDTVNQSDIDRFIGQVDPNKDLTSTLRDFISSSTPTPDPVVDPTPTPDPVVDPTPTPTPDPVVDPTPTPDPVVDPTPTPEPQPDIVDVVTGTQPDVNTQPDINTQPDVTTDINAQPDTAVNTQPDTNQNLDTNSTINLVQQVEDELLRAITGAGAQQNKEYAARLAGQQQVDVKSPDPAQINYFYDFSSIFANPSQEQKFPSPYREGGSVDVTDEILKIMRTK